MDDGPTSKAPNVTVRISPEFTARDCDAHLIWLRRRLRRLAREQLRESEDDDDDDDDDDVMRRTAGRQPLALGHRVYPQYGFRILSIHRSSPAVSMLPRVVMGPNVDPFTPDNFPGVGSYDLGKY
jgi:hypothetical protein